jgi:NAD(P)-dependent dehydrogenase (short-subunit alcohol dehydrogenase family)
MAAEAVKPNWGLDDAPAMNGKLAIVTGATGGLGYETALGLARKGATTILAGRNPAKGAQALIRIRQAVPSADIRFELLDLASLASVRAFAGRMAGPVHVLVNNAGVMGMPVRQKTVDGFEQQIGVNYLGHFALTALLKDALCAASSGGRVVSLASLAHRRATLNLDDLESEHSYSPMRAYAQSKLAMLVFALELQRHAKANGWHLLSFAAHPGWARTEIIGNGMGGGNPGPKERLIAAVFGLVAQSAREGALPSLYAAMAPQAEPGAYYGPARFNETRGAPGPSRIFPQAADLATGAALWALSETLTGITFR